MSNSTYRTQILQLVQQLSESNQFRVMKYVATLVKQERELQKQAIAASASSAPTDETN